VFDGYYESKRVLVTGAIGVKGTWLCLALREVGAQVIGVDNRVPQSDTNFIASGLRNEIDLVQADVTDLAKMTSLVANVDAVFHLAAVAIVGQAKRNPYETFRTNTLGVTTMMEALRLAKTPKRCVTITTDKVYRSKPDGSPWVETDPLMASGPYQVSKACAEFIIQDYQPYLKEGGTLLAVARAGNVIVGGDQYTSSRTSGAGRLVPDCFEALAVGQPPQVLVPSFTRPYTYGLDIISGYMTLLSKLDQQGVAGEAFNFGPYEQIGVPNSLLATKACELWGGGIGWRSGSPRAEPFDHQSLSWNKSQRVLGWRPAFTFHEALSATTRWYKCWYSLSNRTEGCMHDFNLSLMREHREAAHNLGIAWAD